MTLRYVHKRTLLHSIKSKIYIAEGCKSGGSIEKNLVVVKKTIMNKHTLNEIELLTKLNGFFNNLDSQNRNIYIQQYLGHDIIGQNIFIYSTYLGYQSFPLSNIPQLKKTVNKCLYNELFIGILNGLKFIHSNRICHLDIKPHNIILNSEGIPVIIDFELSKPFGTLLNSTGTKDYMAPELYQKGVVANDKIDIYAIGNTIHYIKYDGLLFHHSIIDQPEYGNDMLLSCMNVNPNERPKVDDLIIFFMSEFC